MKREADFRPDDPSLAPLAGALILFVSAIVTVVGWGFFFVGMVGVFG